MGSSGSEESPPATPRSISHNSLKPEMPICVDAYDTCKPLGRMAAMDSNSLIMLGKITAVTYKEDKQTPEPHPHPYEHLGAIHHPDKCVPSLSSSLLCCEWLGFLSRTKHDIKLAPVPALVSLSGPQCPQPLISS